MIVAEARRLPGRETLTYDAMTGDQSPSMRADMMGQSWRVVQPVLDAWVAEETEFRPTTPAATIPRRPANCSRVTERKAGCR